MHGLSIVTNRILGPNINLTDLTSMPFFVD